MDFGTVVRPESAFEVIFVMAEISSAVAGLKRWVTGGLSKIKGPASRPPDAPAVAVYLGYSLRMIQLQVSYQSRSRDKNGAKFRLIKM